MPGSILNLLMSTILGAPLARLGFETIAIDMPGHGLTEVGAGSRIRYDDWVQAGSDLIDAELAKDDRPIVLYGLSAGGMETYHVAALNRKVKGIVGMTFLDQRLQQVGDETALSHWMNRLGGPMIKLTAKTPLAGMMMPMWLASKMHSRLHALCTSDRVPQLRGVPDPTDAAGERPLDAAATSARFL